MKKIMIALATLLTIISNTYAFQAYTQVHMNRTSATIEVINYTNRPMVCSGYAEGITIGGRFARVFMNNAVIYPGRFANLYIYTNNFDIFRLVRPFINCQI